MLIFYFLRLTAWMAIDNQAWLGVGRGAGAEMDYDMADRYCGQVPQHVRLSFRAAGGYESYSIYYISIDSHG
jgi:hypothetical protein